MKNSKKQKKLKDLSYIKSKQNCIQQCNLISKFYTNYIWHLVLIGIFFVLKTWYKLILYE